MSDWSSDVCSSDVLWCAQAASHQRIAVAIGAVERGVVVSDDIDRQASLAQCPHPIKQCERRPAAAAIAGFTWSLPEFAGKQCITGRCVTAGFEEPFATLLLLCVD